MAHRTMDLFDLFGLKLLTWQPHSIQALQPRASPAGRAQDVPLFPCPVEPCHKTATATTCYNFSTAVAWVCSSFVHCWCCSVQTTPFVPQYPLHQESVAPDRCQVQRLTHYRDCSNLIEASLEIWSWKPNSSLVTSISNIGSFLVPPLPPHSSPLLQLARKSLVAVGAPGPTTQALGWGKTSLLASGSKLPDAGISTWFMLNRFSTLANEVP